jgi:AraC-like DNA-binding protein
MLYYFGIGINFFLLLILVTKKGKTLADNILACWLFIIGIHTILYVVYLQPVTIHNIHWIMGTASPLPLLHGPLLYLYTAAVTNRLPAKRTIWSLHFIPAAATFVYLFPLYTLSAEQKMAVYFSKGEEYKTANLVLNILIQLSGLVYTVWSFLLLRKHKKNIGAQFSYDEKINLNWLRYLIYGILAIWIIIIVFKKNTLIFGAGVVFITLLGFLGIRQVGIFGNNPAVAAGEKTNPDLHLLEEEVLIKPAELVQDETGYPRKKYASSGLTPEIAIAIHEKLLHLMDTDKLYTEPELTLAMLAAALEVHPNYLSQVINEKMGKSFFDYINSLRVEEFKRLVAHPGSSQFTIISLAYDCGFNSKSSFNKNFKKVTGQSPSDYLTAISGK